MSDLAGLFPNLARALDDWDGRKAAGDGHDDPSHAGVTDQQIEDYLQSMGSLRAPLNPVVSGQQTPPTPEFANNGRSMPPGRSYMEDPDPAAVQGDTAVAGEEGEGEDTSGFEPPPPPPTPVTPTAPDADFYEIAGRKYDPRTVQAWADFDARVTQDPGLRDVIQRYLTGGTQGIQQTAPTPPEPAHLDLPTLPTIPEEYESDEAYQSLYKAMQAQRDAINRISHQAAQAERVAAHQAQQTYTDIAKGAMTSFQQQHSLDDTTMQAVSRAAAATGFAEKYMAGIDPLTGTPVAPDPYKAVMSALNAGYMMAPETREIEIARIAAARQARTVEDNTRKQKLAGISGTGGSVPRTQTVPSNPQDARAALVEEVSQMFNGSWAGDGS